MVVQKNRRSGGFFIMAAILIGFGWGVAAGDPLGGTLVGTAVGVVIAVAIWLTDRKGG